MSRTDFEELFAKFEEKFPPAENLNDSTLRLTTAEVVEMLSSFWPELEFPRIGITRYMTGEGYKYTPIQYNDRISYYWLVREVD